ncbi:hypothetical protein KR074_004601 [Drosophila pseudoananassae]|nr:hypothetical protein KR074_004601 [Drosophila pseudoananassae]
MLSVQTAGCAGMERLGVPTRTSLSTPPDDRDQFRCRMRVDALQARELLAVRGETVIRGTGNNQLQHQQQHHLHHSNIISSSGNNKQQHSHQQQQRMTTPSTHSSGGSGSGSGGSRGPSDHHQQLNNNSISSNVARGGIEATTLKYGNTGSGSGSGSGSGCYKGDCGNSSTGSTCSSLQSHSNDHHQHYQYQLQQQQTPRCPHHVPLPDSEYGQDRHLQIRSSYQQSEITRSYTKPPPNKTVRDVPEQISAGGCGVPSSSYRLTTLQAASSTYSPSGAAVTASSSSSKSKPNAISKFFSRISSPKSPPNCSLSSVASSQSASASSVSMSSSASSLASSAGVSTSSSASSLAAVPLCPLPVSNAALLKSTACGYGTNPSGAHIYAGLGPSTQLLTSLGTGGATAGAMSSGNCSPERIPTPPLSVSVPIGAGLQPLRSSSSASLPAETSATAATSTQSSSADAPLTTMSRNNSNSSMMSCHCSCNSRNCSHCGATS